MKRYFSFLPLLFLWGCGQLMSQVTIFNENFNNGCATLCLANTYAGWSISSTGTNGAFANDWYISCAENGMPVGSCGAGCGSNATLHVGSAAGSPGGLCPTGDCGAAYDASLASIVTNRRVESPIIDCSLYSNVQLRYNFIGAQLDLPNDGYSIVYSSNGGTTWIGLGNGAGSNCCCNFLDCFISGCCAPSTTGCGSLRQGNWTQTTLALPASANNNPNVRVGFNWTNNGDNLGTDPSVAIDDLELIGDIILDQEITAFSGEITGEGALLHWVLDLDMVHELEILKSTDGMGFELLTSIDHGELNASGNPGNFLDSQPIAERIYYRLRAIDGTGHAQLSSILELKSDLTHEISVFPNPISRDQRLLIEVRSDSPTQFSLEWINLNGQLLKRENRELPKGIHQLQLELPMQKAGIYYLRSMLEGRNFYEKVVVY